MRKRDLKPELEAFALWLSTLEHPTHVGGSFHPGVILDRVALYLATKESR